MKRWWWIGLIVIVVVGAGMALAMRREASPWTSDVPAARAAFDAAIEASSKLYMQDARRYLEEALELDPDFLVAKAELAYNDYDLDPERRKRLRHDVESASLADLSHEERFRIQVMLLRGKSDERDALIDAYLEEHPDSVLALHLKAQRAMFSGRLEEAEALHRRTLELSPNWVLAHNQLGYVTMERGAFEEAENHFVTYRFIAPDQANPHDSLGELYTLLGRYEEAETEYRAAIAAKPDFCPSWDHLLMNALVAGDIAGARTVVAELEVDGGCAESGAFLGRCTVEVSAAAQSGRWSEVLQLVEGECAAALRSGYVLTVAQRAALHERRIELARTLESKLEPEKPRQHEGMDDAALAHMAGLRLAAQGDLPAALERLRQADGLLRYRGNGEGILKLVNRFALSEALRAAGEEEAAAAMLAEVAAVNQRLARHLADTGGLLVPPAP